MGIGTIFKGKIQSLVELSFLSLTSTSVNVSNYSNDPVRISKKKMKLIGTEINLSFSVCYSVRSDPTMEWIRLPQILIMHYKGITPENDMINIEICDNKCKIYRFSFSCPWVTIFLHSPSHISPLKRVKFKI